jgi:hypothetical protein
MRNVVGQQMRRAFTLVAFTAAVLVETGPIMYWASGEVGGQIQIQR